MVGRAARQMNRKLDARWPESTMVGRPDDGKDFKMRRSPEDRTHHWPDGQQGGWTEGWVSSRPDVRWLEAQRLEGQMKGRFQDRRPVRLRVTIFADSASV